MATHSPSAETEPSAVGAPHAFGAPRTFGPDVLFLIAKFALEARNSLAEKPNTAPHKAFLANRYYAQLVGHAAQRGLLMDAAVREFSFASHNVLEFYLPNQRHHRGGDLPAKIDVYGTISWFKNGEYHRDGDQPAVICRDGTKYWYKNNMLHRDGDNPAIISSNGSQMWYKDGRRHRDCGLPAIIYADGSQLFWVDGVFQLCV